jgi:hypothetical protein
VGYCFEKNARGRKVTDYVTGIDISMNHGAFVTLADGELSDYCFVTERESVARSSKKKGLYFSPSKMKDMQERAICRLTYWEWYFNELFSWRISPIVAKTDFFGVEDYAYRAAMNAHQIGEIGGALRLKIWHTGKALRLHDPGSVKMFAAFDGTADKDEMIASSLKRWPETESFSKHTPEPKRGANPFRSVEEDLCDAYAIAKLVWLEVQLRRGTVNPRDLHPKELQVFNRCTKRWPVSLLGRDWLAKKTMSKKLNSELEELTSE